MNRSNTRLAAFRNASAATLTRVAAYLGLIALALMVLSILVPRPGPVMLAMSVGQGIGVLAFLSFLGAIAGEVTHHAASRSAQLAEVSRDDPSTPPDSES